MQRFTYGLCALGLICITLVLALGIGSRPALAAVALSIGTPTPPPSPTAEPTLEPPTVTPVVPTAMASPTATAVAPPAATPTAPPTATPVPPRRDDPEPTIEPTVMPTTVPPTATDTPWLTDIVITKQADLTTVLPGGRVRFTLLASNQGTVAAFDVVVRDAVPEGLLVIDLITTQGDIVSEGQSVTAYVGTLEPGATVKIGVVATVREDVAGVITNTARISTTTHGDDPGNNTSSVSLTVEVPQRQIAQVQPRLPATAEGPLMGANIEVLAVVSPAGWLGVIGALCLLFGSVFTLTFWRRPRRASTRTGMTGKGGDAVAALTVYRTPSAGPIGPPRLGPALPPSAPPAALPPLTPLDRDDALRDVLPNEDV